MLPRTPEQRAELASGGFIVPERAIDAQSLVAYADLVVSAGGTMNREAVALGTPVWTTFEGRLGAVDEALIADGPAAPARRARRTSSSASATRADGGERVRRDPAVFADLLLSAVGGLAAIAPRAPIESPRMRRRIRSAAFPVHRHALPQVALDAGLVALAYYLAYRLRFDGGVPPRYEDLFARTIAFAIVGSVVVLRAVRALPALDALLVAARVPPDRRRPCVRRGARARRLRRGRPAEADLRRRTGFVSVHVPTGVLVLFGLLMLVFVGGTRFVAHLALRAPAARLPRRAATRARC